MDPVRARPTLVLAATVAIGAVGMVTCVPADWTGDDGGPIAIDRTLKILPAGAAAEALRAAGAELGTWTIELAGVALDGDRLRQLGSLPDAEPVLRHVRESLGRPVDLEDLILWLDDVLAAGRTGRRGERFVVPSGRARAAGILVHPDDVFHNRPRKYGARTHHLAVDAPSLPASHAPAADGGILGPGWAGRYTDPDTREEHLAALSRVRPAKHLADRVESLLTQLETQGAEVWLTSTVRRRERGYLMWGAHLLSTAPIANVSASVARLERANKEWGLGIPIAWRHPDGARATQEAARRMADAYQVVYATERGARVSSHYTGTAVDFVAIALPRRLTLTAPDGARRTFDLSAPAHPRDLSLEPTVIPWIEQHFALRKVTNDYPHWEDTRR